VGGYRGDGEGLVEDAVVDQLPVDVSGCLGHALDGRGGNTSLISLSLSLSLALSLSLYCAEFWLKKNHIIILRLF